MVIHCNICAFPHILVSPCEDCSKNLKLAFSIVKMMPYNFFIFACPNAEFTKVIGIK